MLLALLRHSSLFGDTLSLFFFSFSVCVLVGLRTMYRWFAVQLDWGCTQSTCAIRAVTFTGTGY